MAGYIFGATFIAFALWRLKRDQLPEGGVIVTGTVTEELVFKSRLGGHRNQRSYGPKASYVHPVTRQTTTYTASRSSNHRHEVGNHIELMYDPKTDSVVHKLEKPVRDTAILFAIGIGFIAAGFFG